MDQNHRVTVGKKNQSASTIHNTTRFNLTNASAKAFSASRLACRIFCARTGRVGLIGGRSLRGLLVWYGNRLMEPIGVLNTKEEYLQVEHFRTISRFPYLVGLVSREFTSDLGMPDLFLGIVPVCR